MTHSQEKKKEDDYGKYFNLISDKITKKTGSQSQITKTEVKKNKN